MLTMTLANVSVRSPGWCSWSGIFSLTRKIFWCPLLAQLRTLRFNLESGQAEKRLELPNWLRRVTSWWIFLVNFSKNWDHRSASSPFCAKAWWPWSLLLVKTSNLRIVSFSLSTSAPNPRRWRFSSSFVKRSWRKEISKPIPESPGYFTL